MLCLIGKIQELLLAFLLAQKNCLPDHKDVPQNLGELQIIPIYYTTHHYTTLIQKLGQNLLVI